MPQLWTAPAAALAFAMGAGCALCPWIACTFRSTTEAGSSGGGGGKDLKNLEAGSM